MNDKTLAKHLSITVAAAVAGFVLSVAPDAEAEPFSALACTVETDWLADYLVGNGGITNLSGGPGGRARNLHCPVPNSFRTFTSPVFVDAFDGNNELNGQITARVCMQPWWGGPTDCGIPGEITFNTESGGVFTGRALDGDNTARLRDGNRASWYANVVVSLPRSGWNGNSQLLGLQAF